MGALLRWFAWGVAWFAFCVATLGFGVILLGVFCFYVFGKSKERGKKVLLKIQETLINGETVVNTAFQKRVYALWGRRALVVQTASRMIFVERSILGGFSMLDHQWKDLKDAAIEENTLPNIAGSNICFEMLGEVGSGYLFEGADSLEAKQIYAYAQKQEQEWEEKRRVRGMEEMRAVSGGIHIGGHGGGGQVSLEDIEKAKKMLDSGLISDAEFNEIKAKILGRI